MYIKTHQHTFMCAHVHRSILHTHRHNHAHRHLHIHVDMDTMSEVSKSTDISAQIFKHRQLEKDRHHVHKERHLYTRTHSTISHLFARSQTHYDTRKSIHIQGNTHTRIHASRGCKYPLPAVVQNSPPLVWECHIRHNRICCPHVPSAALFPGHRACPGAGPEPGV